ncbi:alpha/beta hydrolase [Calidifontibacter sp. DB0510]|uniref:Alpha/beta hydrolase n=1 Tax=Metallococcus carri TaxID=1656884 RepID=A0A967AYI4_9MICO|nr:alpha/beta hydrolase [Metallococcus carri]NHN55386.1 alpha/beta hydrolase [Metallococcus carri]NOP36463.1 alpha/beta fold hydrolase [Calidifontibacter sp. DB2511S]
MPSSSRVVTLVAAAGLALAGCSGGSGSSSSSAASPTSSATTSSVSSGSSPASSSATGGGQSDPALARFYDQKLQWSQCGDVECAKLTVPVDYAAPTGATIQLAVDRVKAKGGATKGSLVLNPGGPGGSGYDYAAAVADPSIADQVVGRDVREQYDVIGFDPRGVQRSAPITCVSDKDMDSYLGADPTPDDKGEEQALATSAKQFGQACQQRAGGLLGHVSTVEAAKDMDVLRAALGDDKLNYLGKSYGTFLGATYADLFPKRVGRFVLDGVVAPNLTPDQTSLGQANGFETATRAYVKDCVAKGNCPLGSTEDAAMTRIQSWLKQLDATPMPVSGQGGVTQLTEGWATLGIADAMYAIWRWPDLTDAFRQAFNGDAKPMMMLANEYADRNPDGSYNGNTMQAINAISCLDRSAPADLGHYEQEATSFAKTAPTWGRMLAWGGIMCGQWPVKATGAPKKITAAGSGPIVVVGTTRDPATPYAQAKDLASQLQNGHLITYDGDGHTAYGGASRCVDQAVDAYLVNGTVPPDGKTC